MAIQNLRSAVANKRPVASSMSDGQIAVNTNATSTGVFFKDASGNLIKAGPASVGTSAPNSSPAGSSGNSIGEIWLDTTGGNYVVKVWDGSAWQASGIASGTAINASTLDVTGDATIADKIIHSGDTNTAIRFPAVDTFAIETDGTERIRVTSTGALAIEGASNYGTSGQVLTSNANDAPTWQDAGGGITTSVISSSTTAVKDYLYVFTANLTLTLPASPSSGDSLKISNLSGVATCVLQRNGSNIMAVSDNLTLDNQYASFELIYTDTTRGWVIVGSN